MSRQSAKLHARFFCYGRAVERADRGERNAVFARVDNGVVNRRAAAENSGGNLDRRLNLFLLERVGCFGVNVEGQYHAPHERGLRAAARRFSIL